MSETLRKFKVYSQVFGLPGYWLALKTRFARAPYEQCAKTPSGPIHLRLKTSDLNAYDKVFLQNDYDFQISADPAVIVDAGANIGFASIYFARRFPKAKILAIEPELSNFQLLEKNVRSLKNIVPVHAALWREDTSMDVVDPGMGHWGFQVTAKGEGQLGSRIEKVEALSIPTLMQRYGLKQIDVLKVDIEGAEKELFESAGDWIEKVHTIMIELHDRLKPGCSESFNRATADFPVNQTKGENIFRSRAAAKTV